MKKRLFILCLTAALLLTVCLPAGAEYAAAKYEDLWGKFDLQVQSGSGFQTTLTADSQGESLLKGLGLSLAGLNGSFTLIREQAAPENYQAAVALKKGEQALDPLLVFGDGETVALQADFLQETVKLAAADVKELFPQDRDLSWIDVYRAWVGCTDEAWLTALDQAGADLRLEFEMWLAEYVKVTSGESDGMTIAYQIPAADLKNQMMHLLGQVMGNAQLLEILAQPLTAQQAQRYLNPQWTSQYMSILDGVALEGTLEIAHSQSMKGEWLSTRIEMPVPAHLGLPFETFAIETDAGHLYFSLAGDYNVLLRWDKQEQENAQTASGLLAVDLGVFKAEAAFAYEETTKEWRDEENSEHMTRSRSLKITNAKAGEADHFAFEPLTLTLEEVLRSGPDRRNATYVDLSLALVSGSGTDSLKLSGKTSSPWSLVETDLEGAANVIGMDAEQRTLLMTQLMNVLAQWAAV